VDSLFPYLIAPRYLMHEWCSQIAVIRCVYQTPTIEVGTIAQGARSGPCVFKTPYVDFELPPTPCSFCIHLSFNRRASNMSSGTARLQVVQVKAIPPGTYEYENQRTAILGVLAPKAPSSLILPPSLIANPPNDVSSIPSTCGLLTDREIDITENYDAVNLARSIASANLTAVEVVRSFAKRAIIAHQLTCCLTQWFMEEALKRAEELDEYLQKHRKPIGPLHGVPVSIKEHIPVAGTFSSQGSLSSNVYNEKDSQMVKILRDAGAVFYCKTNQPQAVMHLESTSHFGRTLNPFNLKLSAGGSTGGEAALLAMKGSVLGIGTDIGVSGTHELARRR
jgi:amidase